MGNPTVRHPGEAAVNNTEYATCRHCGKRINRYSNGIWAGVWAHLNNSFTCSGRTYGVKYSAAPAAIDVVIPQEAEDEQRMD